MPEWAQVPGHTECTPGRDISRTHKYTDYVISYLGHHKNKHTKTSIIHTNRWQKMTQTWQLSYQKHRSQMHTKQVLAQHIDSQRLPICHYYISR